MHSLKTPSRSTIRSCVHSKPSRCTFQYIQLLGAIVGFANYLIRLYEAEQPRAVVVGWDTLEVPNWRAEEFDDYQGGREFEDEIVDQLDVLPEFVTACGFVIGFHVALCV